MYFRIPKDLEMKPDELVLQPELKQSITPEQAWHYSVIPKSEKNGTLELLISSTINNATIKEELEILLDKKVDLIEEDDAIIQRLLSKHYRKVSHQDLEKVQIRDTQDIYRQ